MSTNLSMVSTEKLNGQYYTPYNIVNIILDLSNYSGKNILCKHAIDNSCGDGAFLVNIVKRYCIEYLKLSDDLDNLSLQLSTYIHGIEIDYFAYSKCIENLNATIAKFGLDRVDWDIQCNDALICNTYNSKMDFVLGNPPYVRVHNVGNSIQEIKKLAFTQNGMTDLYLAFYEVGLKMLNKTGILGYITPSSFFNSIAGYHMRSILVTYNLLDKIVDFKHYQAFRATTYSTIIILDKTRKNCNTQYFQFDHYTEMPYLVDSLSSDNYLISDNFYFDKKEKLIELKNILTFEPTHEYFAVKNGFATLNDKFFIGDFEFEDFTIPIVKASTGKMFKCLFPYQDNKLLPYEKLAANPDIMNYFESNKEKLLQRSLDTSSEWYSFGRSQAINDVYKCKYAINSLIRTKDDIKIIKCDPGVGVYSGLYILTEVAETILREILISDEFIDYISMLGKYKSGGYYTYSSKELKIFLEYKYAQRKNKNEQQ